MSVKSRITPAGTAHWEDDFFSEKNENLLNAWEFAATIPPESHESEDFSYDKFYRLPDLLWKKHIAP